MDRLSLLLVDHTQISSFVQKELHHLQIKSKKEKTKLFVKCSRVKIIQNPFGFGRLSSQSPSKAHQQPTSWKPL